MSNQTDAILALLCVQISGGIQVVIKDTKKRDTLYLKGDFD